MGFGDEKEKTDHSTSVLTFLLPFLHMREYLSFEEGANLSSESVVGVGVIAKLDKFEQNLSRRPKVS